MKLTRFLLPILLCAGCSAQILSVSPTVPVDTPPTISIRLEKGELLRLDAADARIAKLQDALRSAEQEKTMISSEIITSHRILSKLGEGPSCSNSFFGGAIFTLTASGTDTYGFATKQPEPTQYLAAIQGLWLVFTRGFAPPCRGL